MVTNVIYVRATRAAVERAVTQIPPTARSGSTLANALMTRCGLAALGCIKRAFIIKARGGIDEAGDRWAPLKPETIAYNRRHPGMPKAKDRAAFPPSWMLTRTARVSAIVEKWRVTGKVGKKTIATESEAKRAAVKKLGIRAKPETAAIDRWWALYRQGLAIFKGNASAAARRAWAILKGEGAHTILSVFGNTPVDILRDTGLLLNSLSPGVVSSEQVFRVLPGLAIIGTNRKWAAVHHYGSPKRGIPQRRLWPDPHRWPSSWWTDILEQARGGLIDLATYLIKGAV